MGRRIAGEYKTELSMLANLCRFFVVLSFASPYFLTTQNIMNVMSQVSSTGTAGHRHDHRDHHLRH